MKVRLELTAIEIEQLIKQHVSEKLKVEGYEIGEISFSYDLDDENDYHTRIEGALVYLDKVPSAQAHG